jgi:hypothetical protein
VRGGGQGAAVLFPSHPELMGSGCLLL